MTGKQRVVILGSTGSIGKSAQEVVRRHGEWLEIVGISGHRNLEGLLGVVKEFGVKMVCITDEGAYREAREKGYFPEGCEVLYGEEGLMGMMLREEVDCTLVATLGTVGLRPTIGALEAGKRIALSSKEVLVMGGKLVMEAVKGGGGELLPVDSEHSSIFQCLQGRKREEVSKIILTASGGPFLNYPLEKFKDIRPEEALRHPTWRMGPKVTLDSSTLANKGLELIEAYWLFGYGVEQLEAVVHPQSLIHGMVGMVDGTFMAHVGPTTMEIPIQYALMYPERRGGRAKVLDWSEGLNLQLMKPDEFRFPCLRLAKESLRAGQGAMIVFNGANEVAGGAFLEGKIGYLGIAGLIEEGLRKFGSREINSVDEILELDREVRMYIKQLTHARDNS